MGILNNIKNFFIEDDNVLNESIKAFENKGLKIKNVKDLNSKYRRTVLTI